MPGSDVIERVPFSEVVGEARLEADEHLFHEVVDLVLVRQFVQTRYDGKRQPFIELKKRGVSTARRFSDDVSFGMNLTCGEQNVDGDTNIAARSLSACY